VTIRARTPTTDTYSLPQTQEEFFFSLPLARWTSCCRPGTKVERRAVAAELGYRPEQIERAYREIEHKRAVTRPLHLTSLLVVSVPDSGAQLMCGIAGIARRRPMGVSAELLERWRVRSDTAAPTFRVARG